MAPRRWLLILLSLASLVVLSYASVALVLSVPVTDGMAAANALPGEENARAGSRAILAPLGDPARVATHQRGDPGPFGRAGALLVVSDRPSLVPASMENASLVRALAHVPGGLDGADATPLALENLTVVANGTVARERREVDVGALAQGREGFL
ncbi:MAG TPA: hypothetical protein VHH36_00295, partial [Candidatus Thermoplasmatota archaeon]|nr:hypothetical protein [Candidatus Thermoplasmatota archaeon]